MKVALDEGVPEQIATHLPEHDVQTVRELGLKGTINGKLLDAIEVRHFEAFISNDKRLEFEQNLARRPFAVLLLSTNHWPTLEANAAEVREALSIAQPGETIKVDCGKFVPAKLRNQPKP